MQHLGLKTNQVEQLHRLPQAQLLEAIRTMTSRPAFTPVVDGHALPAHPFDPDGAGISADVPMLLGSNATEITFFGNTPLDPIDDAALLQHVKITPRR